MDWYVLFVVTGQEDTIRSLINNYFEKSKLHAVVPKRKLTERKLGRSNEVCKVMFPGYVLLYGQINLEIYYDLKQIPGCYRLLNNINNSVDKGVKRNNISKEDIMEEGMRRENLFSIIEKKDMILLSQLINEEGVIERSNLYIKDAQIKVISGPLKGKETLIKKIDSRKGRARIVLNFMGEEKNLDVGIELSEK
ncbi:antiterminator LoaP [Saccharibacillus brassicae]|uniref:Antiterminator LoaP n=1 Tax=Saccharibacillus brassicae TaxID=2583377 RepID=A0A4Y6UQA8_SACBS|nr:antiterminator LoaP [Saccharibacillus brassicae]QDH19812.1 antiterminator LoaP [Saccharibacillus brassicae]